jgi:hypothetical protein
MATDLPLTEMVLAAGALGTAAYGIVDGFKMSPKFAAAGFGQIRQALGDAIFASLANAYGSRFQDFLQAQYINGRSKGELPRSLRQGARLALAPGNAAAMAGELGHLDGATLTAAAAAIEKGEELSSAQQSLVSRFELAVDTRIEAALALAENKYKAVMQMRASAVAVILSLVGSFAIHVQTAETGGVTHNFDIEAFFIALIVGVAAVPLAPIAKDVSTALQQAARATRATKP